MGKKKLKYHTQIKSPIQVHQMIMKSTLGKAIELRKMDNNQSMPATSNINVSSSVKNLLPLNNSVDRLAGHKSNKSKDDSEMIGESFIINDKSNKNLYFLPFLRERNGLGQIIDSSMHTALKQKSVPSIFETNRILQRVNQKKQEASINPNMSIEQELFNDANKQSAETSPKNRHTHNSSKMIGSEQQSQRFPQLHRKSTVFKNIYNQQLNIDNFNSSKFLDDQEEHSPLLTQKRDIFLNNISKHNINHQLPFQNFIVKKDKNFVLINSLNTHPIASRLMLMKDISPYDSAGNKLKLRDPHKMVNNLSIFIFKQINHNYPCLGTYNPNLELIEANTGASLMSFDTSTLISKSKILEEKSILKQKIPKQMRSHSNLDMNILETNQGKQKNQDDEDEHIPRRRDTNGMNNSKSVGLFKSSLPKIPLDEVYNQRTKIRAMIIDIKSNIYKMDKL